jgi:predicted transposase YdaD
LTLEDEAKARKILRETLPEEVASLLDFDTLARIPGNFVSPEMREFMTDFLFSVRLKGKEALLLIVVEHKSYLDRWAALWILQYIVLAWVSWVRNHPEQAKLPPVLPFILYHGDSAWTHSTRFLDLINVPSGLGALAPYQPDFQLALLDLHQRRMEGLGKDPVTHLFLGSLKAASQGLLKEWLETTLPRVDELSPAERDVAQWVKALFLVVAQHNEGIPASTVMEAAAKLKGPEKASYMNMLEVLKAEGREEGLEKGREEGRSEGIVIGQIRTYQKFLKQPLLTDEEAQEMALESLRALLADLEAQFDRA